MEVRTMKAVVSLEGLQLNPQDQQRPVQELVKIVTKVMIDSCSREQRGFKGDEREAYYALATSFDEAVKEKKEEFEISEAIVSLLKKSRKNCKLIPNRLLRRVEDIIAEVTGTTKTPTRESLKPAGKFRTVIGIPGFELPKEGQGPSSQELFQDRVFKIIHNFAEGKGGLQEEERRQYYKMMDALEEAIKEKKEEVQLDDETIGFIKRAQKECQVEPDEILQDVETAIKALDQK